MAVWAITKPVNGRGAYVRPVLVRQDGNGCQDVNEIHTAYCLEYHSHMLRRHRGLIP